MVQDAGCSTSHCILTHMGSAMCIHFLSKYIYTCISVGICIHSVHVIRIHTYTCTYRPRGGADTPKLPSARGSRGRRDAPGGSVAKGERVRVLSLGFGVKGLRV